MPLLILLLLASLPAYAATLSLAWTNNMLRISGPDVPGGYVETWYLEAFCRSGSTRRDWEKTTIPHRTELLAATPQRLLLRSFVEPRVVVEHEITAGPDEVTFKLEARNEGDTVADVQWFQPCIRVDRFTGANQDSYVAKSFIYTADGLKFLDRLPREEEAVYRGGQVYVPEGIPIGDVNPRPVSAVRPANGLIGCVSRDGKRILATAWSDTQELFQGVIVCLHNDPRIGGLKPHEKRPLRGKIYLAPNDPAGLLRRYERDFGGTGRVSP